MPGRVTIVLEAQNKEALARIKEFGRGVADTVDKLKASNPALDGTRVKVSQLGDAKSAAARASQQWSGVLQVLPGQLGAVSHQAVGLASALRGPGGVAAAMVAVAAAGVGMAKAMGDDIERLDNLSRQTGLAVSSLQAFEHAAKRAGESPDTLVQGLGRVNSAINDVLMGTKDAGKAFQAIGVDLRQMVRDGASTEDVLEATAKALAAIDDPARRAAAAQELFGTRGRAMVTVLDAIAKEGIGGYIDALTQAGIITSRETQAMAREFDTFFDNLTDSASSWGTWFKSTFARMIIEGVEAAKLRLESLENFFTFGQAFNDKLDARVRDRLGTRPVDPGSDRRPRETRPDAGQATKDAAEFARLSAETSREAAEFLRATEDYAQAWAQVDLDEHLAGFERATKSIAGFTVSLDHTLRVTKDYGFALADTDAALGANMQGLTEHAQATERATSGYTLLMTSLGLVTEQFTLAHGSLTNFDAELSKGQVLAESMAEKYGDVAGAVERMAARTKASQGAVQGLAKEFDTLADEVLRDLQSNFSDLFDQVLTGTLDAEDAIVALGRTMQKSIGDFLGSAVVKDLQQFFGSTPGDVQSVLAGQHGFLSEVVAEIDAAGGNLATAFQNLSKTSLQTAQALAQAAGMMISAAAFGTGEGATTGSVIGGGIGGIAGNALGGPGGAALGTLIGGVAGGAIGSLFDDEDAWKEFRTKLSLQLEQAAMQGFSQGLIHAMETGDIQGGIDMMQLSLETAMRDALINAFVQAMVVEGVLAPFIQTVTQSISMAAADGFSAGSMELVKQAMGALRQAMNSNEFREIFAGTVGLLNDLFPGMEQIEQSSARTAEFSRQTAESTRQQKEDTEILAHGTTQIAEHQKTISTALTEQVTAQGLISQDLVPEELRQQLILAQAHAFISGEALPETLKQHQQLVDEILPAELKLFNEMLGVIEKMAEGVVVPITIETTGGGSGGGGASDVRVPVQDGRVAVVSAQFHGGWAGGVRGFAGGGWVTDGVWDRDSVMAKLAREEFVVNNRVTRMPGNAAGLEHLNRTGVWPGSGGQAANAELIRELQTQNGILQAQTDALREIAGLAGADAAVTRQIRDELRRRHGPGRPAGSGVV